MSQVKYPLLTNAFSKQDLKEAIKVIKTGQITMSKVTKNFEQKFAKFVGAKYALMVNSGSSANLLAVASLNFKKNSEIITPNLTFSTTVAPIYQLGLVPHFIGVEKNKFLADPSHIERCINKKTVAIMIPNLLGNIADWKKINIATISHKKSLSEIKSNQTKEYTT